MKTSQKISEAEWAVMNVLWGKSPQTANEIVEALMKTTSWSDKTIRTLINRLSKKEVITYEVVGRVYHYSPVVSENECVRQEAESFLSKVRAGTLKPLMAAFLEEEELSADEIEELKDILNRKTKT